MRNPFGRGERSPSLGKWPQEAYDEERELARKRKLIHKTTVEGMAKVTGPKDELVAKIDAKDADDIDYSASSQIKPGAETFESIDADRYAEELTRAEKYFTGKAFSVNKNFNKAPERPLKGDAFRVLSRKQPRILSNSRIGLDAQIRKHQKTKPEQRLTV